MRKNSGFVLMFIVSLILALAGCSEKVVVKPSDESIRASKALGVLQDMERAYKARDLKGVIGPVSPDLKSGLAEFETGVRKDIETYVKVRLDLNVERVEESGDLTRVAFSWYGKWEDKDGKELEGRGNSVFVFKDGGQMKLVEFIGDSPFGVVR